MPPATPIHELRQQIHGVEVLDPYRWLEDGASREVVEWTAAQNQHTRQVLDGLPARSGVAARLKQALDCGVLGAMQPRRALRFFTRRTAGMDQAALYVVGEDGAERTLVDPGPLSADGTTALDWWTPSPGGELVCFGLSEAGSEDSTLRFVNVESGQWLGDSIPHCRLAAVAFEPGSGAVLYTRYPGRGSVAEGEENYNRHVWRHVIGQDPATDVRVFGEGRDRLDYPSAISFSDRGGWSVITVAQGWDRTSVFLRRGGESFRAIFEGHDKELHAWFAGDRLYGHTNFGAPNYRLVEIDPERPEPPHWRELVPETEHVLVGVAVGADGLVVHHLVDSCSRVRLQALDGEPGPEVRLPELCTVTGVGAHHSSAQVFLTYETFTEPARAIDSSGFQVAALAPPRGFDPAAYPTRRVRVRSRDGTEVPMFLVGRSGSAGPTVLTGYGGFNIPRTPVWSPTLVPFLESGGLAAVACLRGGGEFGEAWHRAGMLGRKQNVFDDFIAAAEWLIAEGLTSPGELGILGGSNGGLLVGAALTQRPGLFGAVVCRVPLLDMVRYERFKVAKLWAAEYGSADDPEQFGWLYAYSPYHRVRDGVRYPPVLLTTGEEDARVDPMHARKMAARLQSASPETETLLRVEERAGHGQGKPASKLVEEEADVWAWLGARLGG